jgi:hypothetical protein
MTDFDVTDYPMTGAPPTQPPQTVDCETLSRMPLPALLYHALVELAGDSYGLPV